MSRKLVFALSLFVLLCSSLYVRFNSLQVKCSNGYAVAPLFTLTDIEGNIVALENLTGKIVVLDFFYPQCQYSDDQIVHLEEIYEKYTRDELEIISISPKEIPIQDLEEFKTGPNRFSDLEYEISWIIARDIETQNVTAKYNILGYPTTVIIDQDGYIRYRHVGLTEESVLRSEIESLLPKTIYVDDDNVSGPWNGTKEHPYQNITSGLEHASDNDTIFVYAGTYYENVVVNKTVLLVGENKSNTIIDGKGSGNVISVTANDVNIRGFTIQSSGWTITQSGVHVYHSSGNKISDNTVRNNLYGILLKDSSKNSVCENIITNNRYGITCSSSDSNYISENVLTNTNSRAIEIIFSSKNIVRRNRIADNILRGVELFYAFNNTICQNTVANNTIGIYVHENCSENKLYHNNFVENENHVFFWKRGPNSWDNGFEGNYWSGYTCVDLGYDGIGDASHVLEPENEDNYPLMGMFSNFNTSLGYHVNVISNSTIEDFEYFESNSTIKMNVSNITANQVFGFCRICIPHALINETYHITVNGTEPYYVNYSLYDDGENRWIYFAYEHSTLEIIVVPEFPSFLILLLFMMAALLAVIVYKRKHQTRNKKREV